MSTTFISIKKHPHWVMRIFLTLSGLATINGCDKTSEPANDTTAGNPIHTTQASDTTIDIDINNAANYLWKNIALQVEASLLESQSLQSNVDAFLKTPNADNLGAAQIQWEATEQSLIKLSLLHTLLKAQPKLLSNNINIAYRLMAHPIQPGYLDRFGEYPYSGLVHDIGTKLNTESLIHQHGLTDRQEVVIGIYAIEFMLFGENKNRSASDYIKHTTLDAEHIDHALESVAEIPNNRRRKLLALQTAQLKNDLLFLSKGLEENNTDNIQNRWRNMAAQQQLQRIRYATESVVTQTLIELVELQNQINTQKKSEDETLPQTRINTSLTTAQADTVLTRFNAIAAGAYYFSDIEQAGRKRTVSLIQNILVQQSTENAQQMKEQETTDRKADDLQNVYEAIKSHL